MAFLNRLIQQSQLRELVDQTLPVASVNDQSPELNISSMQSQSMTNPLQECNDNKNSTEEVKPPVICRVPNQSTRENYKMTELVTNYIKIELKENKGLYTYGVQFDPPIDSKSIKFYLLNQHQTLFPIKTFDGMHLYLPNMLPQKVTTIKAKLKDQSDVEITIKFQRKNTLNECIQFYNVFIRTIMKIIGLIEFNRHFYDPNKKITLYEHNLEIWPGYISTIDEFESGLYLCCDISHRILRLQSTLQVMMDIANQAKINDHNIKQEIIAKLCGLTVITLYNRKTYRIDDIDFSMTPLSTFKHYGTEISFVNYYKKNYDIEIKDLKQPLIITKPKKKSVYNNEEMEICCLIPELCNLTGLTEDMRNDYKLMHILNKHTNVTPEKRRSVLVDLINCFNDHEIASQKFEQLGIKLNPIPIQLTGPVYKQETILLGNKIKKQVDSNMEWSTDVTKNVMFTSANLTNWVILYCKNDLSTVRSFCTQLAKYGCTLGMNIESPIYNEFKYTSPEFVVSTINCLASNNPNLQLIVVIFPNQREDRYNAVKRVCCVNYGIPSQVIISKTLSNPKKAGSIIQKIALQINCKLGGACWAIEIPLENTMIVGIDTYHEPLNRTPSVVGIVASLDKHFTNWYSVAKIQNSSHQELMENSNLAFQKVLNFYKEKNGVFPDKIIIYRDGVSDGELKHVEETEIKILEDYFKNYLDNYCPKITFIVVQKRIHTKIFEFLNEKYSNPRPGTVLDNTVTRRNFFDFFLVSQNVRQGTVNPTHYIVLKNGCMLKAENVQRLSYKLCHMYYNWCGTIKIPAPVQYAHKLAYQIGQNLKQMPHEKLSNNLYYL